jgi:hypothetical protein
MSSTIPPLTMFPLYPGGPKVQNTSGSLNANSAFYLRPTRFTPAYGVNIPPDTDPMDTDTYYTLLGNQTLLARPISGIQPFDTPLSLDGSATGALKQVATPTVAPTIPTLYDNAVKLLSITELQFSDLMAQADFRIPTIGMGLKVTTDGMGNVDTIAISPSSYGTIPGIAATSPDFGFSNRTDVTTGATFKTLDAGFELGGTNAIPASSSKLPTIANNTALNPLPQFNLSGLGKTAGIFNLDSLEQLTLDALQNPKSTDLDTLAPAFAQLYQQQTPGGLAVSGADSALNAEQSVQLAAVQAGLNVSPSNAAQQNIAAYVSAASRPQETYAAAYAPRMDQVMNGRVNVQPWQPTTASNSGSLNYGNGAMFEMGSAVADAMSRKGRGSYIPFQMSGGQSQGQTFGGSNPFLGAGTSSGGSGMGFAGGQSQSGGQLFHRKPLAFTA